MQPSWVALPNEALQQTGGEGGSRRYGSRWALAACWAGTGTTCVMRPHGTSLVLALVATAMAVGCGSHHTQYALHAEPRYSTPTSLRCGADRSALEVVVSDAEGSVLPGARVYVAPISGSADDADARRTTTNGRGAAQVDVAGGEAYAVVAVMHGFLPRSEGVFLARGCSGQLRLPLQFAPMAPE